MSEFNPYIEANAIADELEELGHGDEAISIREAMLAGSTGSEILMSLNFHLKKLKARQDVGAALEDRIAKLTGQISKALTL